MPSPIDDLQHFPDGTERHIGHPAHAKPGIYAFPDRLYVVTCLDNPLRFRSRYENYAHFEKAVQCAGGILITVELAMGDRHFEITDSTNPYHVQVRTRDEMFRKENLQNLGLERLPLGAKYVACIDADVLFTRPDWCQESMHLLQHYAAIQMFTSYSDIGPDHRVLRTVPSFIWNFIHEPDDPGDDVHSGYSDGWPNGKWSGAPGLAWAYRVETLDILGRLLDRCILGGGDSHMAFGLAQRFDLAKAHLEISHASSKAYVHYIRLWQKNAARLNGNIGVMDGTVLHKWHGPKHKRGYASRWKILEDNHFDPFADLLTDHEGVLVFAGNKPKLRDDIRRYLRSRDEDSKQL